jgi:hypothetical protein
MRALKILAAVYETTWDRLVDIDDLEAMPAHDRRELLDISGRGYSDSPDLLVPRQRRRRVSAAHSDAALQFGPPIAGWKSAIVREPLTIAAAGPASARLGGGLPGEITHFTGRDGPMAELRARIAEQTPQGTVVTIYAFDGMAGVGKTAFARHAAQEFAERYPDGAIWVDLYGHTPGMQAREPSAALEQSNCCGASVRWSVSSASAVRPASSTPRHWRWPGNSGTGALKSMRCGDWARWRGLSASVLRLRNITFKR